MMHDFLANNRQDLIEWCRPGFHMFVRTLYISESKIVHSMR